MVAKLPAANKIDKVSFQAPANSSKVSLAAHVGTIANQKVVEQQSINPLRNARVIEKKRSIDKVSSQAPSSKSGIQQYFDQPQR